LAGFEDSFTGALATGGWFTEALATGGWFTEALATGGWFTGFTTPEGTSTESSDPKSLVRTVVLHAMPVSRGIHKIKRNIQWLFRMLLLLIYT
jgi:hypothetical protein